MKIGKGSWVSPKASIYGEENIVIGDNVRIDDFCILSGGERGLHIGSHIHISAGVKLFGGGGLIVEDFSQISINTTIVSQSDDMSGESMVGPCIPMEFKPTFSSGLIVIHSHVFLAAHVLVLPGSDIGEGVSVGSMSLVKGHCVPWKMYKGVPARIYGNRSKRILSLTEDFLKEYLGGE